MGIEEPFQGLPEGADPGVEALEQASEGALQIAEQFLLTVAAGDARAMWALFSETSQAYIIGLGHERGMDFDLTSRLKQGTATDEEVDTFLGDLMYGIQHDLSGVDFSRLAFESKAEPEAPMQVRVNYLVRLGPEMAGMQTAIPAGSILLSFQYDQWKVERLVPRPGPESAVGGPGSASSGGSVAPASPSDN
ncbi:MAG: hypothetical protein ACR2FO_08495 [Actinomycetota bacterium]